MPGPAPKPAHLRQRTNRSAGAATLDAEVPRRRIPALPKRLDADGAEKPWQPLTRSWWRDVWRSPMAPEFLESDLHGLYVLADLVDAYWHHPTTALATEIRLQRQCFGLTPIDRRRLQWEVQRVESNERKVNSSAPTRQRVNGDPRQVLHAIS